jgi:hypothetical protein
MMHLRVKERWDFKEVLLGIQERMPVSAEGLKRGQPDSNR